MIAIDNPALLVSVARVYRPGQRSEAIALPHVTGDPVLAPAAVSKATRAALPMVLDMCRRIVPWATVTLAPRILEPLEADSRDVTRIYEIGGTEYREWGGLARADGIWIALCPSVTLVLKTTAHECWHCLEHRLSPEWIERIDADLAQGFYAEGLDYWDTPKERRARAFEAFAHRLLEGMPPRLAGTRHAHGTGIDEIFAMAWTGKIAAELVRLDEIEAMEVGEAA